MAQLVKNPPTMWETCVQFLGWEDPLRREKLPTQIEHSLDCIVHGVTKSRTPLRLQKYVNHELADVQAGFRKGRGTRDQIANTCWIIKKAREFQKNIYLTTPKPLTVWITINCGKFFKR